MSTTDNNDFRKHHRQRVKNKVYENGFSGMTEFDILELLLFYAIPYRDVKPLAHRLIDEFGSLSRVLTADISMLEKVNGMGISSAIFLKTVCEAAKRSFTSADRSEEPITQSKAVSIAKQMLIGERDEHFGVILLDNSGKVIKSQIVFDGVVNEVEIINRKFLETVLSHAASSVIIFHNHPYGSAVPSAEDVDITGELSVACRRIGVRVKDHLIIGSDDWVSMRSNTVYADMFD